MTVNAEVAKRGRGRPTVLNLDQVGSVTLKLWADHGYANVNWADISAATGVSVRTLTRRFETKAAIAWIGTDAATKALEHALKNTPKGADITETLVEAIVRSIESSQNLESTGRIWLTAVANEPAFLATATTAYQPWIEKIVEFIEGSLPELPRFQAKAIAAAMQAATFSVMVSELAHDGEWAPSAAVRDALQHIRILP